MLSFVHYALTSLYVTLGRILLQSAVAEVIKKMRTAEDPTRHIRTCKEYMLQCTSIDVNKQK